jgi:hypothetical protein
MTLLHKDKNNFFESPFITSFICFCIILTSGALAVKLGQDACWDLKNYHFYNPFAFISGRMGIDFAPAQKQTFFNPTIDLPLYFAITNLNPKWVGFLYGAFQGFNGVLLYLISKRMVRFDIGGLKNWILVLLITLCGTVGYINLYELGNSSGDNIVSIPLLGSVLLVISCLNPTKNQNSRKIYTTIFIAGGLAGAASALKLTCAPFSAAGVIALLFISKKWPEKLKLILFFSFGSFLGFALLGGHWFTKLYLITGNPLFPYFNDLFQSPFGSPSDYRDMRYMADGFLEKITVPLTVLLNPQHFSVYPFRDARLPAYILACVAIIIAFLNGKSTNHKRSLETQYLFSFLIVGYVLWLNLFCIYRYLSVLELLCPIIIAIAIFRTIKVKQLAFVTCCITLSLLIIIVLTNFKVRDRVSWGETYFDVKVPFFPEMENSYVLMTGKSPMSYLIPFFPEKTKFMRIQSTITGNLNKPNGYDRLMREKIFEQKEDELFFVLFNEREIDMTNDILKRYNFKIVNDKRKAFLSRIQHEQNGRYILCPLESIIN